MSSSVFYGCVHNLFIFPGERPIQFVGHFCHFQLGTRLRLRSKEELPDSVKPPEVLCNCPVKISIEPHYHLLDPLHEIHCGSKQCVYANTKHDITLYIPDGALPEKTVLKVGVALYGPFAHAFPGRHIRPVSPILWLCMEPKLVEIKRPIGVVLPHYVNLTSSEDLKVLCFQKAAQHDADALQFEPVNGTTIFQPHVRYGILETTHCCYLCITKDNLIEPQDKVKSNFALTPTIPLSFEHSLSPLSVYFCVTYRLPSCIVVGITVDHSGYSHSLDVYNNIVLHTST